MPHDLFHLFFSLSLLYYVSFLALIYLLIFFFFKQKTAYYMRISDWSSDVCSSDLVGGHRDGRRSVHHLLDDVGVQAVVVADQRAAQDAGDDFRVAASLEQTGREAQPAHVQALLGEVRALDVVARLVAHHVRVLGRRAGRVLPGDVLRLGEAEAGVGVDRGEVRAGREVDATTVDRDFRHRQEARAGLQFTQVVDRLGRRAPATGRDERARAAATVVQVGLVARGVDDLLDVLRVAAGDREARVGRLLDDREVVLLAQTAARARGGLVVLLRERAQAVVERARECAPVAALRAGRLGPAVPGGAVAVAVGRGGGQGAVGG